MRDNLELPKYSSEDHRADTEVPMAAVLMPSGGVMTFPQADLLSGAEIVQPESENEERWAGILSAHVKVSPSLVSVLDRGESYSLEEHRASRSKLPPGRRVVFVPLPKNLQR